MANSKKPRRLRAQKFGGKWLGPVGFFIVIALIVLGILSSNNGSKPPLEQSCNSRKNSTLIHRSYYYLCFNKETKQPNWVLQRLQNKEFDLSHTSPITDYYQDYDIPSSFQASASDYENSTLDIGNYLFPLKSRTSSSLGDSNPANGLLFSVTSPQDAGFHKGYWEKLRKYVAAAATNSESDGFVAVMSGPLFLEKSSDYLEPGHIPVPSHFFQVVTRSMNVEDIEAYIVPNSNVSVDTPLSKFKVPIKELEEKSGINGIETIGSVLPSDGPVGPL